MIKLDYWDSCVVLAIKGWHFKSPEESSDSIKGEIAIVLAERNGCKIEHIKGGYITEYLIDILFKIADKEAIKRVLYDSLEPSLESYFPKFEKDRNKQKGLFNALKSYLRFGNDKKYELDKKAKEKMKNNKGINVIEWQKEIGESIRKEEN